MNQNQKWARVLHGKASADGVERVIKAVNLETRKGTVRTADVITACAQMLGQIVAGAGSDAAAEVRAGIHEMIDGYAMFVATTRRDEP